MVNQVQDDKKHYGKFSIVYTKDVYKGDRFVIDISKNGVVKLIFLDSTVEPIEKKIVKAEFMSNRIYKNIVVFCMLSSVYESFDCANVRFIMEE